MIRDGDTPNDVGAKAIDFQHLRDVYFAQIASQFEPVDFEDELAKYRKLGVTDEQAAILHADYEERRRAA